MRLDTALYVGQQNAEFFNFRPVLTEFVHKIKVAETLEAAKTFLKTQRINLIVLNLRLESKENAAEIVQEIRAGRPNMQVFAVGWPFQEIVAHNCWCIARGIDGTITVDQFRQAISKVQAGYRTRLLHIALVILCLVAVGASAAASGSPLGQFLGAFWVALLAGELAYCAFLLWSERRPNEDRNPVR